MLSRLASRSPAPVRLRLATVAGGAVIALLSSVFVPMTAHASSAPVNGGRHASTAQIRNSVAAPDVSQITPVCTLTNPDDVLGPAEATLPSDPVKSIVRPAGGIYSFSVTGRGIYVLDSAGITIYSLKGTELRSFSVPASLTPSGNNGVSQPVVSPSGDIFVSSLYGQTVDDFSPDGVLVRSFDPAGGSPTNIFPITSSAGAWELAVSNFQNEAESYVYSPSGTQVGTTTLWSDDSGNVSREANGDILYADYLGHVQTWSPDGSTMLSEFGSSDIEGNDLHTGGPYDFYYPGEAVQGPDGSIYTADPLSTMTVTTPDGLLEGTTSLGSSLAMEPSGAMFVVGDTLYVSDGAPFSDDYGISAVPISAVTSYIDSPHAPVDALGWGAGLATDEAGNYFPPGSTPEVTADFDPWWTTPAPHVEIAYSVWTDSSMVHGRQPATTTMALPTTAAALAAVPLTIPAADGVPGPYEMRAVLYDTTTSPPTMVGSTCLPFTVGAAGDRLDLSSLPSGIGGGGPSDTRGVALNAQLGLDGLRSGETLDWSDFLPDCNSSAPTAATCGPSAMTFAQAPQSYFQAAALADADHVHYWVQVSGGDATSMALVDGGWWQDDIEALVSYYANPPADCGDCAAVTAWEPWNEANNTGWSDGGAYVSQVLAPFYRGVKSGEPTATVIGGSSLGIPMTWWSDIIAAGGLSYMDVAGVHPYTGNNDSWEEDGVPAQVRQLQAMLGSTPLWFTEIGWWSDGDYNYLHQADSTARALLWEAALDVPVWNYFYDEGNWGNDGVSFSLVQTAGDGDDYVKPAALTTMVASNQIAGRTYLSMPSTGIPQTYAEDFGPTAGGGTDLTAVWSDELPGTASVVATSPDGSAVPVTITSEYGDVTTVSAASGTAYTLPVSSQVQYVTYPAGDTLSVGPTETFGSDLATSSAGATAVASSGDAAAALTPLSATTEQGEGWSSAPGDSGPTFTVTLASASTVNRVVVDTQSMGSTASGLRHYLVSVESPGGTWTQVADVYGQFSQHQKLVTFAPQPVSAVRIVVVRINFGGYYGGGIPPFWSATDPATAFIHAVEVYAGTDQTATVDGAGLPGLSTADGTSGSPPVTTPPPSSAAAAPASKAWWWAA